MNRFILGVIAVATIAAAVPVSEAAVKPSFPAPFTWTGAYAGANAGGRWAKLGDSGAIGGRALGYNFQYRQFACIRVGGHLKC